MKKKGPVGSSNRLRAGLAVGRAPATKKRSANGGRTPSTARGSRRILGEGRFLRLVDRQSWEYVERTNACGVVAIVAVTPEKELLLTEQYRPSVDAMVIDLPAGLAGDTEQVAAEQLATAAARELQEETGYCARRWMQLADCPTSPGMSREIVTFFRALDLKRTGEGGGDGTEEITVHAVPLGTATDWLRFQRRDGRLVDAKVFAGLFFAGGVYSGRTITVLQ